MNNCWMLLPGLMLCLWSTAALAQTSEKVRYYKERYDAREVSPSKARYSKHIRHNPDSSVTTEWVFMPNNAVIESQSHKHGAPAGLWRTASKKGKVITELDYRFDLRYTDEPCRAGHRYSLGSDTLAQRTPGKFQPPKMKEYKAILDLLMKKLRYPDASREAGIEGRVVLTMTLSKRGKLEDIMVLKSADSVLDKEAARVVHLGREWEPATLDGEPIDLCITLPITFSLD